jgi:hypothetical protein
MTKLTGATLDRAVANAMGLKSVNNCEQWGAWPFPTHPLKPWTKQQEKEYQEQQRSKLPDAPL